MRALLCLSKVAEQASEAIVVLDLDGIIQFVNAAWATMHGYNTIDGLVGKQIGMFHIKEQMKSDVIAFIKEVKRKGRLAWSVEHVRKDGTVFPTKMKMIMVRDKSGKGVGLVSFVSDSSECKQAEELAATNAKLQQEITDRKQTEECLRLQVGELTTANETLQQQVSEYEHSEEELLGNILEAEEGKQVDGPFNPQELKALSELAKRLA